MSFDRHGESGGEPLLLIHGSGERRRVWRPVIERLAREHDLIVVDLPGHGDSAMPPSDIAPTPIGYARMLRAFIHGLDLESAHLAGISVGGWTALELAKLGVARSVVALSPAGLWLEEPRDVVFKLWLNRRIGRLALPHARGLLQKPAGRKLLLGGVLGRPQRIPAQEAIDLFEAFATAPGFDAHLAATRHEHLEDGESIEVPMTIAFGERDRLLKPHKARVRDNLPSHARWLELPGCGHVPTWDDPELVAATILQRSAAPRGPGEALGYS